MIKKILFCALACITLTTATADEGMWLPSLIKERVKDMRKKVIAGPEKTCDYSF